MADTAKLLAWPILVVSLAFPSCSRQLGRMPAEVQRAKLFFESNADAIWRLAHPSIVKYDKLEYNAYVALPTGYQLRFTYHWRKGDVPHTTEIAFRCSPKGTLSGVELEDVLIPVADSSKVPPFAVAEVASRVFKADVKSLLSGLPADSKSELRHLVDQKLSARSLAALWLLAQEELAAAKSAPR